MLGDARDALEAALDAPEDERPYFIRQALQEIEMHADRLDRVGDDVFAAMAGGATASESRDPGGSDRETDLSEAEIVEHLTFSPNERVDVHLDLPSALWARIVMECHDEQSVAEWIERQVRGALDAADVESGEKIEVDVAVAPETYEKIRLLTLHSLQCGSDDPELAWHDAVNTLTSLCPASRRRGRAQGVRGPPGPRVRRGLRWGR